MNKIDINIYTNLLTTLNKNKTHVKDIWVYGNQSFNNKADKISDLDLIVVYSKKPIKITFPRILNKKITGSVIYLPYKHRSQIFLFEELKVFSIKEKKILSYKIKKKYKKYRLLTSFLERYYERRQLINHNLIKLNPTNLSLTKSLLFSYTTFLKLKKNKILKFKLDRLMKIYLQLRRKYIDKKISRKEYFVFIENLKLYDTQFFQFSYKYFETKFKYLKIQKFNIYFLNRYNFDFDNSNQVNDIPKIFCFIYFIYGSQNNTLSRKVKKDIKIKKITYKFFDKDFLYYLKLKINFLNFIFMDLKKGGFKKGLYRLNNYLS